MKDAQSKLGESELLRKNLLAVLGISCHLEVSVLVFIL